MRGKGRSRWVATVGCVVAVAGCVSSPTLPSCAGRFEPINVDEAGGDLRGEAASATRGHDAPAKAQRVIDGAPGEHDGK